MKCFETKCKNEATIKAEMQWGKNTIMGYCKNCAPEWLKNLKKGEYSEPSIMFGINKSWYKKI